MHISTGFRARDDRRSERLFAALALALVAAPSGCWLETADPDDPDQTYQRPESEHPAAATGSAVSELSVGSCVGSCGGRSTDCWCNEQCVRYGDCCPDYEPVCLGTAPGPGEPVDVARVGDGDTVRLASGERVRLDCVDAPESNQPYGAEATAALRELLRGGVRLERDGRDRYGRTIGTFYAYGRNVNRQLVLDGAGWNYDRYCGNRYQAQEDQARAARRGLWSDLRPVAPWDWRRGAR